MAELMINEPCVEQTKEKERQNEVLSSCSADTPTDAVSRRLSEDKWLVQNTLPFILPYLDIPDVLRCMSVCKLWQEIVKESTYLWRSVTLNHYSLNLDRMVTFLRGVQTRYLRIAECEISDRKCSNNPPEAKFMEQKEAVLNPEEWDALQVSVQVSPHSSNLEIYIWEPTSSQLKEAQPHKLNCLSKLGALKSLVLTKIFALEKYDYGEKTTSTSISEPGESSTLRKLIEDHLEKSHPLNYLSFLICEYPKFSLLKTIGDLRFLSGLYGLHLVDIHITEGFESSMKLCTNLKYLRVAPSFRKGYVARDNGRIVEAVRHLNLKYFIWTFTKDYMVQCDKVITEDMSDYAYTHLRRDCLIPFIADPYFLHDDWPEFEHCLPSFLLVERSDMLNDLQKLLMPGEAQITMYN